MPSPAESVRRYRRSSPEEYAVWFGGVVGLMADEARPAATFRTRKGIENEVRRLSKAKVDAAVEDAPVESEDIPNSEDFPAELSYDAMTLAELREECRARGLPVSGTKAELALRLKRDDEGITESAPTPEAPDEESAAEEEVDAPADEAAATEVEMNAEDTEQEPTAETNE
tara:strand:+ start:2148 stop:2660 length:513 start_codon:yes stop_codon:yes gene_type:complete